MRVVVGSMSRSPPRIERAARERLEIRALAPLHVEDLDVLTGHDLVDARLPRRDVPIEQSGSASGSGASRRVPLSGNPPPVPSPDPSSGQPAPHRRTNSTIVPRGVLGVGGHRPARGGDDEQPVRALADERLDRALLGVSSPNRRTASARARSNPDGLERPRDARPRMPPPLSERRRRSPEPHRCRGPPEHRRVRAPVRREQRELDRLQPRRVEHRDLVAGEEGERARAAARHRVPLDAGRQHRQPGLAHAVAARGDGERHGRASARPALSSLSSLSFRHRLSPSRVSSRQSSPRARRRAAPHTVIR